MSLEKELEYAKHRMEVLRMARTMLNEEYINRRAEDHNKWLAESDVAWRTKGVKLPYPAFVAYPTEAQVLAKAQELIKFVVQPGEEEKILPQQQQEEEPVLPPPLATVPEPEVPHAPPQSTPMPEVGTLRSSDLEITKPEPKKKSFWYRGD